MKFKKEYKIILRQNFIGNIACIFLIFNTLSCSNCQNKLATLPEYESVVKEFFSKYSVNYLPSNYHFYFEKRPSGWNAVIVEGGNKVIKNEIFWSSKENKYLEITFSKVEYLEDNSKQINKLLSDDFVFYYNLLPYYGYENWAIDIINNLESNKDLSDSLLFSLGYANFMVSQNYIYYDNLNYLMSGLNFTKSKNHVIINENNQKLYIKYANDAKLSFKKLIKINPNFNNDFGTIIDFYNNVCMKIYLDKSLIFKNVDLSDELNEVSFSEYKIDDTKNKLNTCESNSLLITYTESEFNKFLYIQKKYGYREDIKVINFDMLKYPIYVKSLIDAKNVNLSFTIDELKSKKLNMIGIFAMNENVQSIPNILAYLKDKKNIEVIQGDETLILPYRNFSINCGTNQLQWANNSNYYLKNHLVFIDIINSNINLVKIYLQDFQNDEYFYGFKKYLRHTGFMSVINCIENNEFISGLGNIDVNELVSNVDNKIDWSILKKINNNDLRYCQDYLIITNGVVQYFISKNKYSFAKKYLDNFIKNLPMDYFNNSISMLIIAESYYQIEDFEKGNQILKNLRENLKNKDIQFFWNIDGFKSLDKESRLMAISKLSLKYNQD